MSNEKPAFQAVTGFNGGVSVGIYADTYDEFVEKCREAYGESGQEVADGLLQVLRDTARTGVTEQQAVGMIQQAFPGAQVAPQQYQQPAQQPWGQQPSAQNGPPPGQTCDPRDPRKTKWVPGGYSEKKQKHYAGFWALP